MSEHLAAHLVAVGSQHAKAADREAPREAIEPLQVRTGDGWEPIAAWSAVGTLGIAGLAWDEPTDAVWIAADDRVWKVTEGATTVVDTGPLVDIHELRVHDRRLTVASTGTDTLVTVDLDRATETGRDVLGTHRTDPVTGAFVKATGRTERFHANQAFEDLAGRRWALVHHVTGLQVVQEVASRLLKRQGDGGLVSLDGLEPVDLGLSAPHSVRRVGDRWWVLDSGAGTARILDDQWGLVDTMVVGGWGRGATVLPDGMLAIGISAVRPRYRQRLQDFGDVDNHVAIIDPAGRTVVERITVPDVDQLNAVEWLPTRAIDLLQQATPPT